MLTRFILVSQTNKKCILKARIKHCVKSARIRSFSGLHFLAFGLNTKRYSVYLRIQSNCGKKWTRKTPNTNTFHAMKGKLNLLYTSWFRGLEKSGMAWIRNRKLSFDKNIFSGIKTSNLRSPDSWPRSLKIIISLNI